MPGLRPRLHLGLRPRYDLGLGITGLVESEAGRPRTRPCPYLAESEPGGEDEARYSLVLGLPASDSAVLSVPDDLDSVYDLVSV